jgi:hypothetical protein
MATTTLTTHPQNPTSPRSRVEPDWIGATASASECCSVCGANHCRTVEVGGSTFETVPASLIFKAGLAAAASLVDA